MSKIMIAILFVWMAASSLSYAEPMETRPLPVPKLSQPPDGEYRVVKLGVAGNGTLWIALRGSTVTAAHVTRGTSEIVDLDPSGLKLEGNRLTGTAKGIVWKTAAARPGKEETVTVDCVIEGGKATGATPGEVVTGKDLAVANAIGKGKDWPSWYGATGDFRGANGGHKLVEAWTQARLIWISEAPIRNAICWTPTGYGGFASPIIGDGKVFFNQFRASGSTAYDGPSDAPPELIDGWTYKPISADDEVYAFDAATGALLWKQVFPDASVNQPGKDKHTMINKTGCYHDGVVYMMGWTWRLYALDAKTGKLIWQGNVGKAHEEAEKQKAQWLAEKKFTNLKGDTNSFLDVLDGVLVVDNHQRATSGFDPKTGRLLWTVPGWPARWAHGGKEYLLTFHDGKVLRCVEPKTGKELWKEEVGSIGMSVTLPLTGDTLLSEVFDARKDERGVVRGWKLAPGGISKLWEKDIGYSHIGGGVQTGDGKDLFVRFMIKDGVKLDSRKGAVMLRLNVASGEVKAENPAVVMAGWSGMAWLGDGRVMFVEDTAHGEGVLTMYEATDLKALGARFVSVGTTGYNVPIAYPYVDGRVFIRGRHRIYCYDLRLKP